MVDNRSVDAVLDNFTEAVGTRRDYRSSASERFEAGIGKWIVNRWQNEDVRSRVDPGKIPDSAEKPDRFLAPKSQTSRLVEFFISATGNQQTQFSIFAQCHRLDCEN